MNGGRSDGYCRSERGVKLAWRKRPDWRIECVFVDDAGKVEVQVRLQEDVNLSRLVLHPLL